MSINDIEYEPKEILKLAELSSDVYNSISSSTMIPISLEELKARNISVMDDKKTGFKAQLYKDYKENIILSYKGTQGIKDWWYGNTQSLGFNAAQYKQAGQVAIDAQREFGDRLKITGHSLGGGLATLASAVTNREAITFNSAGVHKKTLKRVDVDHKEFTQRVLDTQMKRFIVKGEILNTLQDNTFLPNSIGLRKDIIDPTNPSMLGRHGMDSVKRALEYEIHTKAIGEAILVPVREDLLVSLINKEHRTEVLDAFWGNDSPIVQKALASNSNSSEELLHSLSLNKNSNIRKEVVMNKTTPIEIIYSMRKDSNVGVIDAVNMRINALESGQEERQQEQSFEEYVSFIIEAELERSQSLSSNTKERICAYASLMEDDILMEAVGSTDKEVLVSLGEYFQELSQSDYVDYDTFSNNQVQEMR